MMLACNLNVRYQFVCVFLLCKGTCASCLTASKFPIYPFLSSQKNFSRIQIPDVLDESLHKIPKIPFSSRLSHFKSVIGHYLETASSLPIVVIWHLFISHFKSLCIKVASKPDMIQALVLGPETKIRTSTETGFVPIITHIGFDSLFSGCLPVSILKVLARITQKDCTVIYALFWMKKSAFQRE